MIHDLRRKKPLNLPLIPDARTVRERLDEVLKEAEKLKVLLRLASEMDAIETAEPGKEGDDVAPSN